MWDLKARLWDNTVDVTADDQLTSRSNGLAAERVEKAGVIDAVVYDGDSVESGHRVSNVEKGAGSDSESTNGPTAQQGVADVQAITLTWTKKTLIVALVFVYILYAIDALQSSMAWSFTPYVTSEFQLHSLTATTDVVAALVAGLARLPLAKILDVWGRIEGLTVMMVFLAIGLIMMAATTSVEMYAAAQVFYQIGSTGLDLVLSVFISDISALRNRGLLFGLASTPYIYVTWAAGPAVQAYLEGPGFRWFYGTFAIVQPFCMLPVIGILYLQKRKAARNGTLVRREDSGRTFLQSIWHYVIELDLIGLVMIIGGLALFLLPFSLYTRFPGQWADPAIICMLVFGIVLLIVFGCYEKFLAPKSFLPIGLLFDRTVFGSCVYGALAFVSFYIWQAYFYSFLTIVNGLNPTQATYVRNIYSIVACFWAVLVGLYIKYAGRIKAPALYFGVPFSVMGVACMVAFRTADADIGLICMCQIFIAVGGGTTVICQQIAAMAATTHQNIATVLAIQYAFASVGGAIGSSIATAVWTGVFPQRLQLYLPADLQDQWATIYGDLVVQASYAVGSPARDAINMAYADAQRYMLIAAACFLGLGWFFVLIWKDIPVKRNKQVKGTVF